MLQFLLSGIRVGLRGRSFQAVFLLGLLLIGVAYLSGNFSPRQPRTVALDVGLSGVRVTLVLLALFWIQELIAREIDRRIILFSLTYPVSRGAFLLGRYAAVLVLVGLAAVVLGLSLLLAVTLAGGSYMQESPVRLGLPFWIAIAGLALDVAVVAAVGLWMATLSTVAVMPLAVGFCFAVAGKALGATLDYLTRGADGDTALIASVGPFIDLIRWLVPDLSRLDWREWPMYGLVPASTETTWAVAMAVAYAAMFLLFSIHALSRREFS
jgi:ABC-type transport system involved in multi-copper enzyme maturation permease subunit